MSIKNKVLCLYRNAKRLEYCYINPINILLLNSLKMYNGNHFTYSILKLTAFLAATSWKYKSSNVK